MGIIVEDITFKSNGHTLKGRTYQPAGEERHPAVAICHGYPGDTKNMDLAEELALNGIATLVFYYQGAWVSEGKYRFSNLVPSTVEAVKYLKSLPYVDPERVGLVSHSMGAVPLTNVMSEDTSIKTGVLMSPAGDISKWLAEDIIDNIFTIFVEMAKGKLDYEPLEEYKEDMIKAAKELNPIDKIVKIQAPIMITVGSADTVTHPDEVQKLYEKATPPKKWALVDKADHGFSEHRILLHEKVLSYLEENL
ncbi:prolyl oligopeptidase family serine peptidase [Candidatus Bathyarchaeota archaeon]|nr:prolyl oligopeptidase family serine peptidase [Candidatus Bathyarchaeota archaeon]